MVLLSPYLQFKQPQSYDGPDFSTLSVQESFTGKLDDLPAIDNPSVLKFEHPQVGAWLIEPKDPVCSEPLILQAGMHPDEENGIRMLDRIMADIMSGSQPVHRPLLINYGNLRGIDEARKNPHQTTRSLSTDEGKLGNLNRGHTDWEDVKRLDPDRYADLRRAQIWQTMEDVLFGGSDTRNTTVVSEVVDLHQSFSLAQGPDQKRYTYAMIYDVFEQFKNTYADAFNGLVLTDPSKAETFAGYVARELNARSMTAEMGQIGLSDVENKVPEMEAILRQQISGQSVEVQNSVLECWEQVENITKEGEGFAFAQDGQLISPPKDLVILKEPVTVIDGSLETIPKGYASLFATNGDRIQAGDRGAAVVKKREI